ncbi:MAG: CopD family protein [Deltaproteobacteria bacterium]|nr:CopD family protein [Deltaproteobacteria bacterium]
MTHFPCTRSQRCRAFWITAFGSVLLFSLLILQSGSPSKVMATQQYAADTGKGCIFCHQESTGGQLKTPGFAYIRNGYRYPVPKRILDRAESLQDSFHKSVRFIVGYLHLLAAVVFFGAIFYIHIFVGPKKLRGGIPREERILGVSCMLVLAVTGAYLTWVRMDRWEQFFNNTFGLMLSIKILLFLLMVAIGVTAITVVHRKMAKEAKAPGPGSDGDEITFANLSRFDGAGGKPAYVAYENRVYDVSESPKWKDGRHFGKHGAGADLTDALKGAPHGPEVFEKIRVVGDIASGEDGAKRSEPAHGIFHVMAYANLVIIFLILACISIWRWDFPLRLLLEQRSEVVAGNACLECHRTETPGIFHDWSGSVHAKVGVSCSTCHRPDPALPVVSKAHLDYDPAPVSLVVSPKTCRGCHPEEAAQYEKSKHANTIEIMWKVDRWLQDGMNNAVERTTGCYACHGTVIEIAEGRPVEGTWPNVGVGRKNPDGSLGSCSSCHTRHAFSVVEARKPEACDQCHLGPDHPQIEIYNESKHGTVYHAEGNRWTWRPDDFHWRAGRDYRAPTCAACHMSPADGVAGTHDVTERLSWETQAPLTVRPEEFKPFPAATDWREERAKMKGVCRQCHSDAWTDDHFANLDRTIRHYNESYFLPIKNRMDSLYEAGLISRERYFDEELEWEFYELWHHEGRRARMGAAMMAPDYAWWHGFYELKRRFNTFLSKARRLEEDRNPETYDAFPGAFQGR